MSRVSRVGDSSGESVGWSDSGLFAAVPGNNTRKWVGPKTKQTYGSKKRGVQRWRAAQALEVLEPQNDQGKVTSTIYIHTNYVCDM